MSERNAHVHPLLRSIVNRLSELRPWDPLELCRSCEHMTLAAIDSEPRCTADGVYEGLRPPSFLPLCDAMRAEGGKCAQDQLYLPRR